MTQGSMGEILAVYADGGVIDRNPSSIGGTWAYVALGAADFVVARDSGVYPAGDGPVTNNLTEFLALCKALAILPPGWSGRVYSDSQVTLGRLFWGWANKGIPTAWVARAAKLVAGLGAVEPILLQGHPTKGDLAAGVGAKRGFPVSRWNVACDEACQAAGRRYLRDLPKEAGE